MFQHFIITRFSYRSYYYLKKKGQDPLNPKRLDHRFKMFEIICLPSILNQVNQDFTWVLIVDSALPEKYRCRLEKLISQRNRSFLYTVPPQPQFGKLGWLKQWINPKTQFVITTTIDDDDGLFGGFTKYISKHINQLKDSSKLPPMLFVAANNEVYWDFYHSDKAPLGYRKQRKMFAPSAAGFSLCCKYPELDFSIFGFSHISYQFLYASEKVLPAKFSGYKSQIAIQNKLIKETLKTSTLEWNGILNSENYHLISSKELHTIISNHPDNIQFMRLFGNPWWREPIDAEKSFPEFSIDFHIAEDYIKKYSKSFRLFFRMVIRQFIFFETGNIETNPVIIFMKKLRAIKKILWGIRNMN